MTPRPNFAFILADDLAYADLGCYGARSDCSPNLDRMAAQGLRFANGYANSPVCSPTRFALATGRWQYRLRGGADEPIGTRTRGSTILGLPATHPTIASVLREGGYRTAVPPAIIRATASCTVERDTRAAAAISLERRTDMRRNPVPTWAGLRSRPLRWHGRRVLCFPGRDSGADRLHAGGVRGQGLADG